MNTKENKMKKIILNLGCGRTRIPESIGVDRVKIENYVDVVHNLDIVPYPFEDSSIDEIHMYHVLEHLHDPLKKIEDLYRILKLGGVLHIRVPHFSSMGAFTDITHIRPFGFASFDCLGKNSYHYFYSEAKFEVVKKRIKYFGQYPNDGLYEKYIHRNKCHWLVKPFVIIINFLIDLSPVLFERLWCYWVGGACEICIDLRKV